MLKTSKIKSVQSAGNPWKNKYGDDMYPWEIAMENGDVGEANTKGADSSKAWPVGEEVSYHLETTEKGSKLTKVYDNKGGGSSYTPDPDRQNSIERQCALKAAVQFTKDRMELTSEDTLKLSDKFCQWIQNKS